MALQWNRHPTAPYGLLLAVYPLHPYWRLWLLKINGDWADYKLGAGTWVLGRATWWVSFRVDQPQLYWARDAAMLWAYQPTLLLWTQRIAHRLSWLREHDRRGTLDPVKVGALFFEGLDIPEFA